MMSALRILGASALVASAATLVVTSTRIGSPDAGTVVMSLPGQHHATAILAAEWLGSSIFVAILIGVGFPVLLITAAVWLVARSYDPDGAVVVGDPASAEADSTSATNGCSH
ncbi:MAG: hypothetical protein QF561_05315 [Phycisphaerales bacterium]|jgi:hypothetical protein|nr:hypothetical protein [Phycisphaerales bacterium]